MFRRSFLASLAALSAGRLRAQVPAALEATRGVHPRLFLNAERVAHLKTAIATTHAGLWKAVRQQADAFAAQGPPKYSDAGAIANDEQLWQREVGNKLPFLAMAWLLTRNRAYLEAAGRWALASCGYPHWGLGREDGTDLAAGHQLFGLALVYDWLYADLDPETREAIRKTLVERGQVMYHAATGGQYWRNSYLQNHLWVNITGMAAAGLALWDDAAAGEQALGWVRLALEKQQRTEAALGPDGASHEGVGYWSYGVEYMLKFWHLASELLGESPSSAWWAHTAAYRLYLGLPRSAWTPRNTIVDLADCPRYDWYGPDYLLRRLAAQDHDGHAQWLAAELETAGVTAYAARWLNLVWFDPGVDATAPSDLPTLRHFTDMGIVAARSDWSGDESLVVFKCGPPIGHETAPRFDYDPGSGHVHPDANHFVLFGGGEWLIRDDGYAWKQTGQHNTLLIEGQGQLGEGLQWFRGIEALQARANPGILKAESSQALDEIAGEAATIYPKDAGLRRFTRRLLYLKPDVLIVADDIETEAPRHLELRFHPEHPCERQEDGALLARGERAALRIEALTPEDARITAGETPVRDREGKETTAYAVRIETTKAQWRNAVALSWAALAGEPAKVRLTRDGDIWTFTAGERSARVNWAGGSTPG